MFQSPFLIMLKLKHDTLTFDCMQSGSTSRRSRVSLSRSSFRLGGVADKRAAVGGVACQRAHGKGCAQGAH